MTDQMRAQVAGRVKKMSNEWIQNTVNKKGTEPMNKLLSKQVDDNSIVMHVDSDCVGTVHVCVWRQKTK